MPSLKPCHKVAKYSFLIREQFLSFSTTAQKIIVFQKSHNIFNSKSPPDGFVCSGFEGKILKSSNALKSNVFLQVLFFSAKSHKFKGLLLQYK